MSIRKRPSNYVDLTGQKFGRLTVIRRSHFEKDVTWYECQCDCGNICVKRGTDIKRGHTKSCGCLHKRIAREQHISHGESETRLYREWQGMKRRCYNPNEQNYPWYGGKGIKVCSEWKNNFEKFRDWALTHGYADHLTLDRINGSKNYGPDNCRWITIQEQQFNKCSNHFLEHNGRKMTVTEWERELGYRSGTIKNRIRLGWSTERILTEPVKTEVGFGGCKI